MPNISAPSVFDVLASISGITWTAAVRVCVGYFV